jgi:hypothetical protein
MAFERVLKRFEHQSLVVRITTGGLIDAIDESRTWLSGTAHRRHNEEGIASSKNVSLEKRR